MIVNSFKKKIERIILLGWCIFFFLLVISSFSNRISPLFIPCIAYLGLFFPFILISNVLFFFFFFISRKWKQTAICSIVFFICFKSIYTYFPFHIEGVKKIPNNSLHLLTYNVMHFENFREHTKENPNPILQYVINRNPDIICFQEFGTGGKLTLSLIKKALCTTPHFFYLPSIGVALFSKYPFLSARKIPFKSQFNGAFIIELDINGHKTILINCHLESNKISDNEKKDYYYLTKTPNTNRFRSVMQMLFRKLTPAFKIRAAQSSVIAKTLMKMQKNNSYILVCGDLNDTPISYAYRTVRGKLNDAFIESGDGVHGMGISFHSHRFLVRIDYIFCSKNIKTYYTSLGELTNSDHYPIETYFRFI